MKHKSIFIALIIFTLYTLLSSYSFATSEGSGIDIKGLWQGSLSFGSNSLRIVVRISDGENGILKAELDSPDQGVKGLKIDTVVFDGTNVKLEVKVISGYFEGIYKPDSTVFAGSWHQNGLSLPLNMKKVNAIQNIARAQEPKPPFPYKQEDVIYENKAAGIKLGGTLTLPESGQPFPAVLMITGSGQQNRDEELFGHKPFLVIADYLTRKGIAVLRVDDRGIGESTGNFAASTSEDFTSDVLAGIEYLKSRKDINVNKIGLIGHSEGGMIAPMAASKSKDVSFIILMAGPGIPCDELLILQGEAIARSQNAREDIIKKTTAFNKIIYNTIKTGTDTAQTTLRVLKEFDEFYNSLSAAEKSGFPVTRTVFEGQVKSMMNPWFKYFLNYDPAPALKKVKCPVLALNGSKDLQVLPEPDLNGIKKALTDGGNKNFEVKELTGLNHLFQTAKNGSIFEYSQIDETIAPAALQEIGGWILKTVK